MNTARRAAHLREVSGKDRGTGGRGLRLTAQAGVFAIAVGGMATVAPAAWATAEENPQVVLDHGHVDVFYFNHEDGEPYLALKDDTVSPYEIRDPDDVEIHVKEQACTTMPADSEAVLEELRGTNVYYLPLTQDPDLVWPGWESQPLNPHFDSVDIHVENVDGPGDVYLWTSGSFGGTESLLNDGGYQFPGTIHQSSLAHVHANWAFTEPGEYRFTVSADVRHSGTGNSTSVEPETYYFTVGDGSDSDCGGFTGGEGGTGDEDADDAGEDNALAGEGNQDATGGGDNDQAGGTGGGSGDDGLAETGTSAELMTGLGIGLLVTGAGTTALLLNRRQRDNSSPVSSHSSAR